jgi:hypothetical protein
VFKEYLLVSSLFHKPAAFDFGKGKEETANKTSLTISASYATNKASQSAHSHTKHTRTTRYCYATGSP